MNVFSVTNWIQTRITRLYYTAFYWFSQFMVRRIVGFFCTIRVTGKENLPREGAFLLVCNHISHFDPPLLAAVQKRKIYWVVALEMYAHPVGDFFFKGLDAIPINRQVSDRRAVRDILRRLKEGQPVGIFPEGGIRSGAESILGGASLDDDVASLAQIAGVRVVPSLMLGTDKLYAKRAWWWRTTIDIRFGQPISVPDLPGKTARKELTNQIEQAWRGLGEELKSKFALKESDWPHTAQERWAEAAPFEKVTTR